MRTWLLLAVVTVLATSSFAQSKPSTDASRPVFQRPPQSQSRAPQNFHTRSNFSDSCCFSAAFGSTSYDSGSSSSSYANVGAHGGPDWQSSNFMTFSQALAEGQQRATLTPTLESKSALVQRMLDLIQQVRAAEDQNRANGNSGQLKWADLKPAVNPADYKQPSSTYMKFSQALALGEQESAQEQAPPPTLGEVAQDAREAKSTDEKATVVIKQDAKGNAIIVHKQPQQ
jgi:hypothetical protein